MIGVLLDQLGERVLVDPPDFGRDVVEGRIPAELLPRCGAPVLVIQRGPGVVALEGEWRARIAP